MKNNYIIYIHINKINNKKYIGQTCQKPEKRWNHGKGYEGCHKFWNAIQKYGWDNFEHKILISNLSSKEADRIERKLIKSLNTINNGYNISTGGKIYYNVESYKEKLHEGLKKRWQVEGRKEAYSQKMKQYYNSLTEEEKYHLYDNRRGELHPASKKVVCRETGDMFNSLTEAAQWAGISKTSGGNISAQIKGTKNFAGRHPITNEPLHWYYLGEENNLHPITHPKTRAKKVKNLETELIFNSVTEAAKWCHGSTGGISESCRSGGKKGRGRKPDGSKLLLHWIYI